jgi:hypothetical protein
MALERPYIVSRTHSLRSRVLSRQDQGRIVQDSLAACDLKTRSQIIWAKNNFAIGRGHYHQGFDELARALLTGLARTTRDQIILAVVDAPLRRISRHMDADLANPPRVHLHLSYF